MSLAFAPAFPTILHTHIYTPSEIQFHETFTPHAYHSAAY